MRTVFLLLAISLTYALLRGWPENWGLFLRALLAGLLLLAALSFWKIHDQPPATETKRSRPPIWQDLFTAMAAIIGMEFLLLGFLLGAPPQAETLAVIVDDYFYEETASQQTNPSAKPSNNRLTTSGHLLLNGHQSRTLETGREVFQSNRPEVYLWPKSPRDAKRLLEEVHYIRSFTLAQYDNNRWSALPRPPRTLSSTGETLKIPRSSPPSPEAPLIRCEVYHLPHLGTQSLVITPPTLLEIQTDTLRQTGPSTFRLPPLAAEQKSYRYQTTTAPLKLTDLPRTKLLVAGNSPFPSYLKIPDNDLLENQLTLITNTFSGSLRDQLEKIRDHLAENYRYSLFPKNPVNIGPLENFLTGSREGYCDHYSTATALLARSLGIPSRVAYGWAGGKYFQSQNLIVYRARESHAWTEIFLKDHGWVIFDTTPAAETRQEGLSSLASANEAPPSSADLQFDDEDDDERLSRLLKPIAALGGLALILFLFGLFLRRAPVQTASSPTGSTTLPRSPHYLEAFRRISAQLGLPMQPGTTLKQHLAKLQEVGLAPENAEYLLSYHYQITYGTEKRQKATEKALSADLKKWERARLFQNEKS